MDRRSRKTRSHLVQGLIDLLQQRSWDSVSVQDVCDAADIARSTFYLHFAGKAELLDFAFRFLGDDLRSAPQTRNLDDDCQFSVVPELVDHMTRPDHAFLFNREDGTQTTYLVRDRLLSVVEQILEEEIQASQRYRDTPASALSFISAGILGVIGAAHTGKDSKTSAELRNEIDDMISKLLMTET